MNQVPYLRIVGFSRSTHEQVHKSEHVIEQVPSRETITKFRIRARGNAIRGTVFSMSLIAAVMVHSRKNAALHDQVLEGG